MLGTVWRRRQLVMTLIRRQYQLRYRQSFAGFAWALIPPLAALGVATVVFHRVAGVDTGQTPYILFTMAALVPWSFFASSLTFGVPSIVGASAMVTRLAFPRAVLPLSMIGMAFLDLAISVALFLVVAFVVGSGLPLTALWFPVLLAIEIVFVVGMVLLGSALNVFARDVRLAVPLLVQFWLFITPVMYPLSSVPEGLRPLYLVNPMTGLVESFRQVLTLGSAPDPSLLAPAMIGAVAALLLGVWYFAGTERRFADVI
jgi:lipopolysaccharide transport system permease protein